RRADRRARAVALASRVGGRCAAGARGARLRPARPLASRRRDRRPERRLARHARACRLRTAARVCRTTLPRPDVPARKGEAHDQPGPGRTMTATPASPVLLELHARFLAAAVPRLAADSRIVGLAAGGSYVTGTVDEFSDLDLVVAVEPEAHDDVMRERQAIAA